MLYSQVGRELGSAVVGDLVVTLTAGEGLAAGEDAPAGPGEGGEQEAVRVRPEGGAAGVEDQQGQGPDRLS